jgi:hypothetical protein
VAAHGIRRYGRAVASVELESGDSETIRHRLRQQEELPEELGVDEFELPRPGEQARSKADRFTNRQVHCCPAGGVCWSAAQRQRGGR